MSQNFHVWYAKPLPWDVESAQAHWQRTRDSGVHEPRLVRCVQRLEVLLDAYEPDTVWNEVPEAFEPCAALNLAPMTGSLELVAQAIATAAAEQGLCVYNPFDSAVWLPDGRVMRPLGLTLAAPAQPSTSAVAGHANRTEPDAEATAVADALRGDGALGNYLLAKWAPLLRQAGVKVRARPSTEHPWCVFTGKVLRVHVHCTVRHSVLKVSIILSPGGKAMPAALQTEFGVGSLWVDLVALARQGGLPVVPDVRHAGPSSPDYSTDLANTGGDPARLADQWLNLFRVLVRWLQPLDDIQALAQVAQDPGAPLVRSPTHPIEGYMLSSYMPEAMALLARQPGAALAAYRRLALTEGNGILNRLDALMPPLPAPARPVLPDVEELLVWQGQPDAAAPLDALGSWERLQAQHSTAIPTELQWFLDATLTLCPAPDPSAGTAPGPWAESPATSVRQPWLRLAFALDESGKLRGHAHATPMLLSRVRTNALYLGLTVYSTHSRCAWTADGRLHTPFGSVSLRPLPPPALQAGAGVSAAQAYYAVHDALNPIMQRHGFGTGHGASMFGKANAHGVWTVDAHLSTLGDEGLTFLFRPYHPPSLKNPSRHFHANSAAALLGRLSGQPGPEAPAAVHLVGTSPERLARAVARVQSLLHDSVFDLLHWLDDPEHCRSWLQTTTW